MILIQGFAAKGDFKNQHGTAAQKVIKLENNLRKSVSDLLKENFDILVYTEIFSTPTPYCLAHNRIAPVQIVLPGNSMTTGLQAIDYYVSSTYTEIINSQEYYTEKLFKVDVLPSSIDLNSASNHCKDPDSKKNRSHQSQNIIYFPHSLLKYHPDWDLLLEAIASNLGDAKILISDHGKKFIIQKLIQRWRERAPLF